jgi:hypothetical protein
METIKQNFKIERSFAYSGGDQTGEPIGIHIIKSGWRFPDMYHVLIEYGDFEQTDYQLLTREQIEGKYNLILGEDLDFTKIIKENPNDMELGKIIRSEHIKTT